METLVKVQTNNKVIIEKGHINFKKSPKERLTQTYATTRLESLEEQWKEFIKTHRSIIERATESDMKSNSYFTNDLYDRTEEIYYTYKSELKELINVKSVSNSSSSNKSDSNQSNVKLPKISLPVFSGQYSEWITFRDLFLSLIHKNQSLDTVQKLYYLKGHLSGEAEQLLRHTPVTASNYEECWSVLVRRYDNKRFLANCMLKRFINQPSVTRESSHNIKKLLDTTIDCLHGLRTLDIDVSFWDTIVVYLVSSKLDDESRKLWETNIGSNDHLPTFEEFKLFLESRFRSLEFMDTNLVKSSNSNNSSRNKTVKTFHVTEQSCVLCAGDHKLCNCKQFARKSCDERREFVRASKLCFKCLAKNHSVYQCRQFTKCHVCKKKHHSLLHPKGTATSGDPIDKAAENKVVVATAAVSAIQRESTHPSCYKHGLLATALVHVESRTESTEILRALLDQGSQVSFITEAAVQFLGLRKRSIHPGIHRLGDDEGSSVPSRSLVTFKLQSRFNPDFSLVVDAYVLKRLTNHLPDKKIIKVSPSISSLQLADPSFHTPGKIDLLLGTRVVGEVLLEGLVKGPVGTPITQNTELGWIVSGEIQSSAVSRSMCYHTVVAPDVNDLLRKFWELESEPSVKTVILTEEEQQCEDFYSSTTKRDATGRYVVKLPFKTNQPLCTAGGSEIIARRRFLNLEKRLLKDPQLETQYSTVINEYIQLGHSEIVPQIELHNDAFYLPHHAVVREDKRTTKVRVVFDASCTGHNGVSLNKESMVGPTLQLDLRQIIMRWRCHPICLVADIIKMYRQVRVANEDADYQRILWRDNPEAELQHLRLLRVTFGTSSAPYLAVRTLQQLARDEGQNFPLVADKVLNDFYVDDLLTGCQSVADGEQIYHQMNELLGRGGFHLQQWSSNSNDLLNVKINVKVSERDNFELKGNALSKILGLTYDRGKGSRDYLVQFHQRHKWAFQSVEPNVADVVLVMEDDLPPARWLHGLIVKKTCWLGQDHEGRVPTLQGIHNKETSI